MTASASSGAGPVTIVAIGAGNRTNKYLEYAVRHPERLNLVGVVELNPLLDAPSPKNSDSAPRNVSRITTGFSRTPSRPTPC